MPNIRLSDPPLVPPVDAGPVTSAGSRLYDRLTPVATYDADNGYVVRSIAETLADSQAIVDQVARDSDTHLAWQAALDPDATPAEMLPWLAQFAGTRLLPADSEQQQRDRIKQAAGFYRGTVRAIREEVQRTLIDTLYVRILERVGGDPWAITVITRTGETPDPAASERAALAQKPAGMILTFVVSDAPVWAEATETWTSVAATWTDATVTDVT